jgi:hypothetical protein
MSHSCCKSFMSPCHHGGYYPVYQPYYAPVFYPLPAICPCCLHPHHLCCCAKAGAYMKVPEYMKTGAAPKLKVTVTDGEGATAFEVTTMTEGYHVKDDFSSVAPGSKLSVEVTDCTVRLRWCEVICC